MNEKYIFLKEYTGRLIEKGKCFSDIGLWNGKMGIAIYLLHVSRLTQNERYENEASKLIAAVYNQISLEKPFFFDSGLIGIGCGFEYIIHNGFANADRDEILSEIDLMTRNIIDFRPINDLGLRRGVCGIGFYLYYRLKNRVNNNDNMIVLKLKEYLIYLIDLIEDLLFKTTNKEDYNDTYFLLARLHQLDVINHKVEKLLAICSRKIIDCNYPVMDNYELLGIDSLKMLKSWI